MSKPMKLAIGIGVASMVTAGLSWAVPQPYAFFAAWTAVSCALVSGAYLGNWPAVFGKRRGRLQRWAVVLLLPYLSMFWFACWLMRVWRQTSTLDEIAPGVYVGGRLRGPDLPNDTTLIVDLTSEFSEPRELRNHPGYRGVAVLDGAFPPNEGAFRDLLDEVASVRGSVVFHCDAGRGRAPTAGALAVLWRGMAEDAEEAIARVVEGRPCASLTRSDLEFIQAVLEERRVDEEEKPAPPSVS